MASWKLIFLFTFAIKSTINVVPSFPIPFLRQRCNPAPLTSIRIDSTIDIGKHNGRFVYGTRSENEQPLGEPFIVTEAPRTLIEAQQLVERKIVLKKTATISNTVPGRKITRVVAQSRLECESVLERADLVSLGEQTVTINFKGEPGYPIIFKVQLYGVHIQLALRN